MSEVPLYTVAIELSLPARGGPPPFQGGGPREAPPPAGRQHPARYTVLHAPGTLPPTCTLHANGSNVCRTSLPARDGRPPFQGGGPREARPVVRGGVGEGGVGVRFWGSAVRVLGLGFGVRGLGFRG